MGETDEYRYNLHVYDGLIVSRDYILGFDLEATGISVGCTGTPTPLPGGCAISPGPSSVGAVTSYSCSGVQ